MKLYNVNIYKEITFICGYYGENDLVNKVLSHVCTHLTLIHVARAQHPLSLSLLLFLSFVPLSKTYIPLILSIETRHSQKNTVVLVGSGGM